MNKLTIGIPTYNREEQLKHQLKCLLSQDLSNLEEIIIVDNNSNYNIEGLIKSFDCPKIRLVINSFNIKMATNMEMPFLYCKTEWLWLLSDDDEVLPDSINTIVDEINSCSTNTGMIKFAIDRPTSIQKEYYAKSLEEYIDYYYFEKPIRRGDLVFISTNVCNVKKLNNHLGAAFEFSYTYIGFLIPVILGLNNNTGVKFSANPVVSYLPPKDVGWSFGTVGKGLSTLSHIPLNISKQYRKKFLEMTMLLPYTTLITTSLRAHEKTDNIANFKIIYNNIYKYYIPWKAKFLVNLFFIFMSTKTTQKLTFSLYKFLKKIK